MDTVTSREAAGLLGVTATQFGHLRGSGRVVPVGTRRNPGGSDHLLYRRADVLRLKAERAAKAAAEAERKRLIHEGADVRSFAYATPAWGGGLLYPGDAAEIERRRGKSPDWRPLLGAA